MTKQNETKQKREEGKTSVLLHNACLVEEIYAICGAAGFQLPRSEYSSYKRHHALLKVPTKFYLHTAFLGPPPIYTHEMTRRIWSAPVSMTTSTKGISIIPILDEIPSLSCMYQHEANIRPIHEAHLSRTPPSLASRRSESRYTVP